MSLRKTTFVTLAILLTLVGLVVAVLAYWAAAQEANEFLDLQQRQIARYVGDLDFASSEAAGLPPHDPEDDYAIEVTFADGRAAQCSLPPCRFPAPPGTSFSAYGDAVGSWRVFSLVLPGRVVQVAQQVHVRREMATNAALRSLAPFLLAIPLIWLVVDRVVVHVFARFAAVTRGVAGRAVTETSPIPTERIPLEVLPLIAAMNSLLARLRQAMDRQRAFVSDAAHELRTPLAALTIEIGNLRGRAVDPELTERLADLEAAARRASGLTAQLLRLARHEAEPEPAPRNVVALDELAVEIIGGLMPLAAGKNIDVGMTERTPATVVGTLRDIRVLLEILVENALRYTPEGGRVDVAVHSRDGAATVEVTDTGPGIPPEFLPQVFERFFRVAGQDVEGSGLGLAIARVIAERHGIELSLSNRACHSGLTATLRFRARDPERAPVTPSG